MLLYRVLATQSQPRLQQTMQFFKALEANKPLRNMQAFLRFLGGGDDLFRGLKGQPGWGNKTAALLVRNLAVIERTPSLRALFWEDLDILHGQEIHLPVDAVILEIFAILGARFGAELRSFNSINSLLVAEGYSNQEMLVWDDLWFWGFITQRSSPSGGVRQLGWNEAKYWTILNAGKSPGIVAATKKEAIRFVKIVRGA